MKIEHLAIWVSDLEKMKEFYGTYFDGRAGEKYFNPKKEFESYFLSFDEGARIELMRKSGINKTNQEEIIGLAHIAISVGSKSAVDQLTERLRSDGFTITGEPRTTGDGYYESVILDPEGNRIEITV
ncbi:MAG: VOC family protein [Bacteroidetes bacterium]|nr:VOC family protein [Bacteroidota bacterium]